MNEKNSRKINNVWTICVQCTWTLFGAFLKAVPTQHSSDNMSKFNGTHSLLNANFFRHWTDFYLYIFYIMFLYLVLFYFFVFIVNMSAFSDTSLMCAYECKNHNASQMNFLHFRTPIQCISIQQKDFQIFKKLHHSSILFYMFVCQTAAAVLKTSNLRNIVKNLIYLVIFYEQND